MSFVNPYNFATIDEKKIARVTDWKTHEKITGNSGKLVCEIHFMSNFITAGKNNDIEKKQLRINGKIGIQASSLKGMLRATSEAISNSCISMISNSNKYLVDENVRIDSCDVNNGLCICCRLFGTTAKEGKTKDESFTYKGKVVLSDAEHGICTEVIKYLKNHSLSSPKTKHKSFYFNGDKIKGRKFYYHQKEDKLLVPDKNNKDQIKDAAKVTLIEKGARFKFVITFENLTDEEYGLLLWTLELEPGLGHKIGMAKPLGLGSCVIKVTGLKEMSKNRYLSMAEKDSWNVYKDDDIEKRIQKIREWWKPGISKDLQCILKLNNSFTDIRYPDKASGEFETYPDLHLPCNEFSEQDEV